MTMIRILEAVTILEPLETLLFSLAKATHNKMLQ